MGLQCERKREKGKGLMWGRSERGKREKERKRVRAWGCCSAREREREGGGTHVGEEREREERERQKERMRVWDKMNQISMHLLLTFVCLLFVVVVFYDYVRVINLSCLYVCALQLIVWFELRIVTIHKR